MTGCDLAVAHLGLPTQRQSAIDGTEQVAQPVAMGFQEELKARLLGSMQSRFHKLEQGQVYVIA